MSEGAIELEPGTRDALAGLLLTLADDEFVLGFWDSEWTGIAPMLEEDVAMSSVSQDEIGHARAWYELLAGLTDDDADRLAFGRAPEEYRHAALMNHPRTDWAFTIARRWLYEHADAIRLDALARSSYAPVAELAAKMRREETYHLLHFDVWLKRLADGGDGPRQRLESALHQLWPDAQTIFAPLSGEGLLTEAGILPAPLSELAATWRDRVRGGMAAIGLAALADVPAEDDGRERRTDDFAWLHGQFTLVARSDAAATW